MVTLYIFQTVFVCFHFADTFWSRITHQQCKLRRIADEKEHNKNISKTLVSYFLWTDNNKVKTQVSERNACIQQQNYYGNNKNAKPKQK